MGKTNDRAKERKAKQKFNLSLKCGRYWIFPAHFLVFRNKRFALEINFPNKLNKVGRTKLMPKQIFISQGQIDLHNAKLLKILAGA